MAEVDPGWDDPGLRCLPVPRVLSLRLSIALLAFVLVAAACGDDESTPPTSPDGSTLATTPGGDVGAIEDDIAELIAATERIRGLEFLSEPMITILSSEELAERIREDIAEEVVPEEIAVDEAVFELLGIIDPGLDLLASLTALYAEQVAGFYDSDTGELVIAGSSDLSPLSKTIVVHELVHLLTDQHFSYSETFDRLVDLELYHQASALQALVEGDATQYQLVYMQQELSREDQVAVVTESLEADTSVLDSLPNWIGEDLAFPYDVGFAFVRRIIDEGGITQLNQAYELLPTTTEQIMHPPSFLRLERSFPVDLPATDIPGYSLHTEGEFGEWNLQILLLDGVAPGDAVIAGTGWGGDDHRIMSNGEEVFMAYLFMGDTPRDAEELEIALLAAIEDRMRAGTARGVDGGFEFSRLDYAFVQRSGAELVFVAASDPDVGRQVADLVRLPVDD